MLAEFPIVGGLQLSLVASPASSTVQSRYPKMLSLGLESIHLARLLRPGTLSRTGCPSQLRRRNRFACASLDQGVYDAEEANLVAGHGDDDLQLDCSVFEEVFPSTKRVKKPVGARVKGLPTPQSTLIPDYWRADQDYFQRGKKERKKEFLSLQMNAAKNKVLQERATRFEAENEQRFLRGQELVSTDESATSVEAVDESGNDQVEVANPDDGKPKLVSKRATPKDYRNQLQFLSFDDIVRGLKDEESEARRVEAEHDHNVESEDYEVELKRGRRQFALTEEEKAIMKSKKVDLAAVSTDKWSPLHTLAASGQIYLAAELLKTDVLIDSVDNDGLTSLHRAVQSGRKHIIRLLLKAGADVNVVDNRGASLLHYSAQIGNHEISKLFIRHGLDVNAADEDGWTPLHVAVQSGRMELIKALVYRGADISLANKDGITPLDLALAFGSCFKFYDAIEFLKEQLLDASKRLNLDSIPMS